MIDKLKNPLLLGFVDCQTLDILARKTTPPIERDEGTQTRTFRQEPMARGPTLAEALV